ncbi:hypothetical protein ABJI51_39570 [Amycolatopsis sp. NEAU-NG30]|uniref:Uncharacterized protein n=1 Tax=Amycolatopsis melonis TaxID=3156488 RepID=A0ABV0LSG4_9PSEU
MDRTFMVKVRQAGLWEIPAGRLAQTHASSEAVKRAGMHLLDGHSLLDQLVREEFDKLFVSLLRSSHGKIFATIAEVRAGTQNDLVRRLARQANQTVMDHMEVLEDTGLVSAQTLEEVGAAARKLTALPGRRKGGRAVSRTSARAGSRGSCPVRRLTRSRRQVTARTRSRWCSPRMPLTCHSSPKIRTIEVVNVHDERPVEFVPRSVTELAADPAWTVTRARASGQWLTAERVLGHGRLIGLTPIHPGAVALMLWSGGEVVEHLRTTEAEACATAHRWAAEFLGGRQP